MRQNINYSRGYVLLPVAVAIALIGIIAYFSANQSAQNVSAATGELEAARAEYVAQAGLQHALREAAQQGCGPYTDLTNVAFGNDSYTTTLTTGLGATTAYTITVDQDGWIRSDQPTVNKGGDSALHIRFESGTIERPIYRYDLASILPGSAVLSARAWFYVTKEHPEGPVNIHRLSADWLEADATWDSMGDNMDDAVLASIPAQAAADVWVSVNLTPQVQAWVNGEPNYGIALNSTSEGTHGDYASRESANAPYLEVVVGTAVTAPATLKAMGTLASGVSRSISRDDVVLYQRPRGMLRLQPDAVEGKDAEIWDQSPDNNYGNSAETWVSSAAADTTRSLLHFDIDALPAGARILEATLSLERQSGSGADQPVSAHRITNFWSEGSVTWNQRTSSSSWDTAGGDFDNTAVATTLIGPANQRYTWNITPLVQGWADGSYPNYGVVLVAAVPGLPGERFYTSDHTDPTLHPRLTVSYNCACGEVCLTPQGSGRIALIVDLESLALRPQDRLKRDSFESWGYDVDYYDDDLLWLLNTANYDVAYVSESAAAAPIGSKFTNDPIAVVYEQGDLNPVLGVAGASANTAGNSIDVVDSSHFITAPFAGGNLSIYSAPMELLTLSGTGAPGSQTLALAGGVGSLVVLNKGAAAGGDIAGQNAAGRRVMLPLGGLLNSGFDWNRVNANGRLLVQRAIEWGIGNTSSGSGPGLWISTGQDVSGSGAPGLDNWADGEALEFADPDLVLEPGTTSGTFASMINLDNFTGDADIDALHYVGSDITVGGTNNVNLQKGDLLLSTANDETLTSTNSISVGREDVFVFRPNTLGDYSAGTFIFLIDGSMIHGENDTVGVSLVEKDTQVGDGFLLRGWFILAITNRRDVIAFAPNDVGEGTTGGGFAEFIDGPSLSLGSEIRGMELAEDQVVIGGHTIPAGSILLTLNNDDTGGVGDNLVPADSSDIFYLTVTQIGASPAADATLLFEGADVNLDTAEEHLQAIALPTTTPPDPSKLPIAHWRLDETSGPTAADSEGGHHGTVFGPGWTNGQDIGALDFDGPDDYVDLTSDAELDDVFDGGATVTAWIYARSWGENNHGRILDKTSQTNSNRDGWMLAVNGDNPSVEFVQGFSGERGYWRPPAGSFSLNQWVHVAVVYDASSDMNDPKIYLDGVEQGPLVEIAPSGTISSDASISLRMGNHAQGTTRTFDGKIDDVRIYDAMLSPSEIAALAAPPPRLPIAHWKLDETSGITAADSEGGHDGTLTNGPVWADGAIDGGIEFDDPTQAIIAPHDDMLSITGRLTLMAWVNMTELKPNRVIVHKGTSNVDHNYYLGTYDDNIIFALSPDGGGWNSFNSGATGMQPDTWYHVAVTFDDAADRIEFFLDGVKVNEKTTTISPQINTGGVRIGRNHTGYGWPGLLDDVRIYNFVLDASEILDVYQVGSPQGVGYTEMNQEWSASAADTWETVDMSVYGVPPNSVLEVAINNFSTSAQRWGGVRAVGSSLDRRLQLHEAEGGGVDAVVMHVQADAGSRIEHYADNTSQVEFTLLGYWVGASYVELFDPFTANDEDGWISEDLAPDGLGPNQTAEIAMVNTSTDSELLAGVRATGESHQRRFSLHEAESGGVDALTLMVQTDASSRIEVYAEDDADIDFYVLGYWSLPPGTYTETGAVQGQVSTAGSWETVDLAAFGVPPNSVAQFVIANERSGDENQMGVRAVGSGQNRRLQLQEAEAGGADLATMHVNVDSASQAQWAAEHGASGGLFYPVGWWVLP